VHKKIDRKWRTSTLRVVSFPVGGSPVLFHEFLCASNQSSLYQPADARVSQLPTGLFDYPFRFFSGTGVSDPILDPRAMFCKNFQLSFLAEIDELLVGNGFKKHRVAFSSVPSRMLHNHKRFDGSPEPEKSCGGFGYERIGPTGRGPSNAASRNVTFLKCHL